MPEVPDDGTGVLDTDTGEPEPRTRRPVLIFAAAGFLLISLVGRITVARSLRSGLSEGAPPPGDDGGVGCSPGDIIHRTQADETVAEFLDRNGYPPTMLTSAADFRDINGQPLCPQGSSLETCEPGPDHVVCLPPPATETPPPVSTEPPAEDQGSEDGSSESPTRPPRPTPTPTATPVYIPPPPVICGDQICSTEAENSDLCPQDCPCVDNGTCEPGEGANCLDCGEHAGSCQAPCSDSSQCVEGLSCAGGICWDACVCGGECGGGQSGGGGGGGGCGPNTDQTARIVCEQGGGTWDSATCTCN